MSNIVAMNSFPTSQEFQTMKELGNMAVKSGFLPTSIKTAEQAVIVMLKGRELGIPPMQAFSSIAVVNGKPTMSAELMLSMIYKNIPGAVVDFDVTDANKCEITAKRPNGKKTKFSFTMADAKTANLTGKGPWVTYPSAMLRARCISAMARAMFPDALSGVVYTPEELGAEIDEEGRVVDPIQPEPETPKLDEPKPKTDIPDVFKDVDYGAYKVTGGKFNGKTLSELDIYDLAGYVTWVKEDYAVKKRFKEGDYGPYNDFMTNAEAYLTSKEFVR